MLALLCFQASLLVQPQYFEAEPPELRSARHILLIDTTSEQRGGSGLSPEAALAFAQGLRERIVAGERFEDVARDHSNHENARRSAVLGTFAQGMLAKPLDGFLFAAEIGDVSEPLVTRGAVHLLQRIDTHAAVLQIFVAEAGDASQAKLAQLQAALKEGADFAELAKEHSEDADSAARGGQFAIYERGTRDTLLKAAAFDVAVGEVTEPVRTGLGYHILKRVEIAEVDAKLAEHHWARFRAILVTHRATGDADPAAGRTRVDAQVLLEEAMLRLEAGDDFGDLAAELSDDPGAAERRGDLGWVHRFAPDLPRTFERAFLLRVGEVSTPIPTSTGLLLFRREA